MLPTPRLSRGPQTASPGPQHNDDGGGGSDGDGIQREQAEQRDPSPLTSLSSVAPSQPRPLPAGGGSERPATDASSSLAVLRSPAPSVHPTNLAAFPRQPRVGRLHLSPSLSRSLPPPPLSLIFLFQFLLFDVLLLFK
ncbi:hypothetical protein VPH35_015684 [Triticum aestivum]